MSIVVIGVNHRTGPLELLERVAVPGPEVPKAVIGLTSRQNIREAVVLTTCNRTEVYAVAEKFHGAYADIRDFFAELSGLAPDELPQLVQAKRARIGVVATPPAAAQDAADRLVAAGITSILNFAPVVLNVPGSIEVRKVDLAVELQILSYYEQRRSAGGLPTVAGGTLSTGSHRSASA